MGYVKLADVVDLEEIRQLIEVDAKPLQKMAKEEDSVDRFWEVLFSSDGDQEDLDLD